MDWDIHVQEYENYLRLERSLSSNSVEAYVHDAIKLKQFLEISNLDLTPLQVSLTELRNFIEYINYLGMTPFSQARII